jgi:O-antigen/teichoic acid export membrane protein
VADERPAGTGVEAFSDRVLTVFVATIATTGLSIVIGLILARVLGPAGKGEFNVVTLLPVTLMVLTQFGLPQALGFFAARGQTDGINRKTVVLAAALGLPVLALMILLIPVLRATILGFIDPWEIVLGLASFPLLLHATFTTGVILARQAVRWYAFVNVGQAVISVVLFVLLLGVLQLGVVGALWVLLAVNFLIAAGFLVGSVRVTARDPNRAPISYRELFRYGLPLYPGALTQHFSVRLDVYLLAGLLADPAAPIGYYSVAVTMAQLVMFLPTAVSSLFFPHVAGSSRESADRQVPMLSRVTLLLTTGMAVLLIPAAIVLIRVFLPAFESSLAPLFVILPGVVALSLVEVLGSYVYGVGAQAWSSAIKIGALVVNAVANLILIPRYGIVGAAASSLISYTATGVAFSVLSARLSGASVLDFWIPRRSDVQFVATTTTGMILRMLRRGSSLRSAPRS